MNILINYKLMILQKYGFKEPIITLTSLISHVLVRKKIFQKKIF